MYNGAYIYTYSNGPMGYTYIMLIMGRLCLYSMDDLGAWFSMEDPICFTAKTMGVLELYGVVFLRFG